MGTRGFIGFVVNGTEKITYNHFDSYPDSLGIDVLGWLRKQITDDQIGIEGLALRASRVEMITNEDERPTPEHLERAAMYAVPGVGGPMTNTRVETYYQLLRGAQGDLEVYLRLGLMVDNASFALDSLFCEWGYLIDLDAGRFEVYRGFQESPPKRGRWATPERAAEEQTMHDQWCASIQHTPGTRYYAVDLAASWPLDALPDDLAFLTTLMPKEVDA